MGRLPAIISSQQSMHLSFQKQPGNPTLGIAFFWKLTIETRSPVTLTDRFIPELFLDYFFVHKGNIQLSSPRGKKISLPQQTLKTLHTHPVIMVFSTPLVLFGARLSLKFAETYQPDAFPPNSLLEQQWIGKRTDDLNSFAVQITEFIQTYQIRKNPYPMFKSVLEESDWLVNFSPRHKRRLYKATFGLSRKELMNIQHIHSFLEQTCDFASENPRIIQHVNPGVFYDQPHLNHTFKKMTGFSPVEYFEAQSVLQDNLMSASYNAVSGL